MASTTITLSQPAYERLKKLKQPGESFSDVVLAHLHQPANTCGELLDLYAKLPPPQGFSAERSEAYLKTRKRRSNRG